MSTVIRQWKADILHLHWLDPFYSAPYTTKSLVRLVLFITQLYFLRMVGVKLVWTVHNIKSHYDHHILLERLCNIFVARLSHKIIVHCETAIKEVAGAFRVKNTKKIIVIPHGNYIDWYENNNDRVQARKALNIQGKGFVFLFLGAIRPYKGLLELITAFKKLQNKNAHLVIAGKSFDEEFSRVIREKIGAHDNIKFNCDFVPENKIQMYMNAADVVVFPYLEFLTSGAVILAMSFSRPCIAPFKGCFKDVLSDLGAFLYDTENEDGLFEAMDRALCSVSDLDNMGKHNRKIAEQLDWNLVAKKTFEVYRYCLNY